MFLNSTYFLSNFGKILGFMSTFHIEAKKSLQNEFPFLSISTKIGYQIDEIQINYVRYDFISKWIMIKWLYIALYSTII